MVKTEQTGLYDATNEHDACGVGMVVNIHGNKSHELVDSALKVLENMRHRGAEGADNKTGDGAGIMLQIPHEFILLQGIPVPEKGKYGTGLVFLPKDEKEQAGILSIMIEDIVIHLIRSKIITTTVTLTLPFFNRYKIIYSKSPVKSPLTSLPAKPSATPL